MKLRKKSQEGKSAILHFTFFILCSFLAGVASATATFSFGWYRNAPVSDFPVPITLEDGVSGLSIR